jgi:hypothetical protein
LHADRKDAPPLSELTGGLKQFQHRISDAMAQQIVAWQAHPELRKLAFDLESLTDETKFMSRYAEAVLARHLIQHECALQIEVPTPAGKTCDFAVHLDNQLFFLHVKWFNTDRPMRRAMMVSSRLRYLERLPRPYVVSVHFSDELSERQMQQFVKEASEFIMRARVGDEFVVRERATDAELGHCRIVAPGEGPHVSLALGVPSAMIDELPRVQKLLRKAYQQFMPKAANVIVLGSASVDDVDDVDVALLGSHIERWDAVPPRGRRIAHGRGSDGFWYNSRYAESNIAGWFLIGPDNGPLPTRLWTRPAVRIAPELTIVLERLFGPAETSPPIARRSLPASPSSNGSHTTD